MNGPEKPVPVPDRVSEGFWASAARHVLAIQQCDSCGRLAHPPVTICPGCLSTEPSFSFRPTAARGRVRTWTVMRDAFLPGFREDIPWIIGEAELDEAPGVRLLGRMVERSDVQLHIDDPVTVIFEDVAPGVSVPRFRLASGGER